MSSARLPLVAVAFVVAAVGTSGCTTILGDFHGTPNGEGSDATSNDGSSGSSEAGPGGKPLGASCASGAECALGFCTDGVCCNNACGGTCESCNQPSAPGTCSPIVANTDPEMECVMVTVPVALADGGPGDGGADASADAAADAGDGGGADGATSDASGGIATASDSGTDGAVTDAGPALGYNPPDGGVSIDQTKCAGSCNGKGGNGGGACVYPDATKSCGTQFCNTSAQQGGFVCDGAGHCGLNLQSCTDYSCSNATGSCGTSCSSMSDCLPTDFCDGATGKCRPKLGNGVFCGMQSADCQSGFCDDTVCCDTDCSKTTGGNCNQPGKEGLCACSACATGPCAVYYADVDGDGYGDLNNTKIACAAGGPPSGYVAASALTPPRYDCDDKDANVHPFQTQYFTTPSKGTGTYDYDCDGQPEKGIPEYPGDYVGNCGYCGTPSTNCNVASTTCSSAGQQSTLSCSLYSRFYTLAEQRVTLATQVNLVPITCLTCGLSYCGLSPTPDPNYSSYTGSGFAETVDCGTSGTFIYCGTCAAAGDAPSTSTFNMTQSCR